MKPIAIAAALTLCACELYQDVGNGPEDAGATADADTRDANLTDATPADVDPPQSGRMTVHGRIFDLETGLPVSVATPTGELCDAANPTASGPCSLRFALYDALAFANNPTGAAPITFDNETDAYGSGAVRDDGTFVAENLVPPQLGFLAIAVFDAGAAGDPWRTAAVMVPSGGGRLVTDIRLRALRTSTDQTWTATANYPFGTETFADRGVYLATFVDDDGIAVSDVKVTNTDVIEPGKDFYFDDSNPWTHTVIDLARDSSGPNGSALMVDVELSPKSGTGNELAGCEWPEDLGAAIPGVVLTQMRHPSCQ